MTKKEISAVITKEMKSQKVTTYKMNKKGILTTPTIRAVLEGKNYNIDSLFEVCNELGITVNVKKC